MQHLLPLNVEAKVWVDSDGGARINFDKEFELTPRLALIGEAQYDTHYQWEGSVGIAYTIAKKVSFVGQWHSDFRWGGGLQIRF